MVPGLKEAEIAAALPGLVALAKPKDFEIQFVADSKLYDGRYGNVGRNLINGVAQSTTDLALVKAFPIGDRFGKIQFRAEFYNTFNQVNFGSPTASLNNRNFGRILSAGSPRILQFALRYTF